MPIVNTNFVAGKMNKSVDERLVGQVEVGKQVMVIIVLFRIVLEKDLLPPRFVGEIMNSLIALRRILPDADQSDGFAVVECQQFRADDLLDPVVIFPLAVVFIDLRAVLTSARVNVIAQAVGIAEPVR